MTGSTSTLGTLALILACGPAAYSQSMTTGAVSGTLRGPDGAPVGGALVTATSNQVQRTAVSQANGTYHFGLLNPGDWKLEVTKAGFMKFQTRLTVTTNNDQTVNIKLGALQGVTVEVIDTSGAVDFTTTTQGMNLDLSQIESLPKTRDFNSLAYLAPGATADYSPASPLGLSGVNINGASSAENQFVIDGMSTNDYRFGTQGSNLKNDFIEQVEIQTGGFRPEYSALGGVINAVTKSGSNTTKGSAWVTWDPGGSQAVAKGNDWVKQSPPQSRMDVGFELGGPILKDQLFYFVGVDSENSKGQSPLPNDDPGLVGAKPTLGMLQVLGKVNWYATRDLQFTFAGSTQVTKNDNSPSYMPAGSVDFGINEKDTATNLSVSMDWTLAPDLLLSAKFGKVGVSTDYNYPAGSIAPVQSIWDGYYYIGGPGAATMPQLAGLTYYSGSIGPMNTSPTDSTNTQARIDLSWLWHEHSFKFGVSQVQATSHNGQQITGPVNAASSNGQYALIYDMAANTYPELVTIELHSQTTGKTSYTGFYAQDIWQVTPGVRLMYGARMESQSVKEDGGRTFLSFKGTDYIQPRLGLTWDVHQDGRTKVSASYAIYYEAMPSFIPIALGSNQTFIEKIYGAGGPSTAFTYTNGQVVITAPGGYDMMLNQSGQTQNAPVADGIKLPRREELVAGFDQDLSHGWWVGIHGKYRKLTDPIEISALSDAAGNYYDSGRASAFIGGTPVAWPGQAILWNPGPTASWTAQTDPSSQNSGQHISVADTLFPKLYNEYKSLDFTLMKRTERDSLVFSYTWSRLEGNYQGVSYGNSPSISTPGYANIGQAYNNYFMVGTGRLTGDRPNAFKLQATHRFTVASNDLNVGLNGVSSSGVPISHYDDTNDFTGVGARSPVNGQLGQFGRTPWISVFDLHLDYHVSLSKAFKLSPYVDCFNLTNTRQTTYVYETATQPYTMGVPDPRLDQAKAWVVGRRYTLGAKITF